MSASRRLAFDLSQLPAAQRERLLAELPADRRAHMEALVAEIAGLLSGSAMAFERQLELAHEQSMRPRWASLSEPELSVLLSAEHRSVQRRITAAVVGNRLKEFPAAVAEVLESYLERACESRPLSPPDHAERPRSWFRLWQRDGR